MIISFCMASNASLMVQATCRRHADVAEHGYSKTKIKVFVDIENEFIQILIKIHLVICLALNKRPFTKERKKEEESKTIRRSGAALKKNEICQFV